MPSAMLITATSMIGSCFMVSFDCDLNGYQPTILDD
jgi:hypothetical protein